MDFKKIGRATGGLPKIEKRCLSCDQVLNEKDTPSHLYLRRFCSQSCMQKYFQ